MGFKILAGDFPKNSELQVAAGTFGVGGGIFICSGLFGVSREKIDDALVKVEIITEENKKKFIATAGWGLVGGVLLGPLGVLAGVLAGGNKKEVCVACTVKDGRRFMALVDVKTAQTLSMSA